MAPVFIFISKDNFWPLINTIKQRILQMANSKSIEYNTVIRIHCGIYEIYKPSAQALSSAQAKQGHYSPGPSGL